MSDKFWIYLAGIHSFGFAILHIFFWKMFNWKDELKKASYANRAIIQVLNLRLIYILMAVGTICFLLPEEIVASKLGHAFLIMMTLFWVGRLIEQFIFLKAHHWLIHLLTGLFVLGILLFGIPVLSAI